MFFPGQIQQVMRVPAILLLTLWMFIFHALDADCLLQDCHCAPGASCSVPLTVQPAQAVAVRTERVAPVPAPPPVAPAQYSEQPHAQPPQAAPPLLTPPRAPPA